MLAMTPSILLSPSTILIESPILYGKEKNIITPDVILLRIDHEANNAIPTTAKKDEANIRMPLTSIPQIIITIINKRMNKDAETNLLI
jgi:hypothetical protein